MGNVGTVTTLLNGTPDQVRNEVKECMDAAKEGGRFILSTSDQIARDTPFENIRAFVGAAIEFGKY
jgi:uroporphyrinogen decarboxylase